MLPKALILLALLASVSLAQEPAQVTPGTFLGVIVEPPEGKGVDGVLFLRARNGQVRAVQVRGADVDWAAELAEQERVGAPANALRPGSEIRVMGIQAPDGLWQAQRVEVTIRTHASGAGYVPFRALRPLNDAAASGFRPKSGARITPAFPHDLPRPSASTR